jgi:hypothetical protein
VEAAGRKGLGRGTRIGRGGSDLGGKRPGREQADFGRDNAGEELLPGYAVGGR